MKPLFFAACAAMTLSASGGSLAAADLLHPAPAPLRELATDRPDKTECAITVDAGHWQLEMDLAAWRREQDGSKRTSALSLGALNLKAGLTDAVDLQLGFECWAQESSEDLANSSESRVAGNGDFVARMKVNLWGNDGGASAFAVMPFIKAPSAAPGLGNQATEGGVILPLGFELPGGFGLGTMLEFDFNQNQSDRGYHNDTIFSAALSRDLWGGLGAYVEFWRQVSGETGVPSQDIVAGGLTFALNPDTQLDVGVNVGTSPAADDLNVFLGLSVRI